mgnify:CR=1 FL=1
MPETTWEEETLELLEWAKERNYDGPVASPPVTSGMVILSVWEPIVTSSTLFRMVASAVPLKYELKLSSSFSTIPVCIPISSFPYLLCVNMTTLYKDALALSLLSPGYSRYRVNRP